MTITPTSQGGISISNLARVSGVAYRTARRFVGGQTVRAHSKCRLEKAFQDLGGVLFNDHTSGQNLKEGCSK